jgi:hypothetical protein
MYEKQYEFTFADKVDMEAIEGILLLAVVSVEGIHGRARVRLDADYHSDPASNTCRINEDNDIGRDICRVFTEFLSLELGEELFSVRHVNDCQPPNTAAGKDGCHE